MTNSEDIGHSERMDTMTEPAPEVFISADSHFLEPPDLWREWLPSKYHDRAPRLVSDGSDGDAWLYAGTHEAEPIGLAGLPGRGEHELRPKGVRYDEARRGTFDGAERVVDQEIDGISAEVIFPTYRPMSHFLNDPDRDFVLAGVEAYNLFVLEGFCAAAPGRLFPIAQLPTTGVSDCIQTLEWAAERDYVGVVLPCWPSGADHLGVDDALFWERAQEIGLPVCIHASLRSREERLLMLELCRAETGASREEDCVMQTSGRVPVPPAMEYHGRVPNVGVALGRSAAVLSELLMSGLFEAFPAVRVGLMETWVGWVPRILEALDDTWRRNRRILQIGLQEPPSHYWRTNVVASFLDDRAGMLLRDAVGVENMMWSSDYPHFCTFWPDSKAVAFRSMSGLPPDERAKIVGRNCMRFFRLQGDIR